MQRKQIFKRAIGWWGMAPQLNKLIEECSELIQAVCKYNERDKIEDIDQMCEEIADVKIMIGQMEYLYKKHIDRWMIIKLKRLKEKLDAETKGSGY